MAKWRNQEAQIRGGGPDVLNQLMTAHKKQYPADSVASVVRFVPGTDLNKAVKFLEECKKRGIIVDHVTRDYHSHGGNEHPVWYIP